MGPRDIPLDTRLETARYVLRAVSEEDIPMVWSATRHPGFNDGMRWDPPASPEDLKPNLERSHEAWRNGESFNFTIVDKSGAPVGRIGVRFEAADGTWAVGYFVHPDHWGRGCATEAAQAVLDFAFSRLGARRVLLGHATWNHASRRVAEKLGMRFVHETPRGFEKHGKPVPELVYVMEAPANKAAVGRYMEAFGRSDHQAVLACLTDDVEWIVPGAFHLVGKAAFDREIENPAFEPRPRIEVTRLIEEADVVVAEGTVRTTRKEGGELHLAFCDVFEMRLGRIRRLVSYLQTLAP